MRKLRRVTALLMLVCAPVAVFVLPANARAQAHDRVDRDVQRVVFDDDLLNADLGAPFGARVFGTHLPPARTQLIRPRTNFLVELYRSVEHL